jgi:hypothetical protein
MPLTAECTPDRSKLFGSHGQRPWIYDVLKRRRDGAGWSKLHGFYRVVANARNRHHGPLCNRCGNRLGADDDPGARSRTPKP